MSRKNSLNTKDLHHRKQPIHFYPSSRASEQNIRNAFSSLGYVTSPPKYPSSKMSPVKSGQSTAFNRSPDLSIKVDRVLNPSYPSKYTKFSTKIDLLQKNLNRLNGQHASLRQMFDRSSQLTKCTQIFCTIDKLKQKLQESKTNKYIQEKRYEARHEIVFEEYINKFTQLKNKEILQQTVKIEELQKSVNLIKKNNDHLSCYDQIFSSNLQNIQLIKANSDRFLQEIRQNLQKESIQLITKIGGDKIIEDQKKKVSEKIQLIKVKLGQLKCITEFQMFLEKQYFMNQNLRNLKDKSRSTKKQLQVDQIEMIQSMQLQYLKEQRSFVGMESLDRLTFQLANVDSKFVRVLQKYQANKNNKNKGQNQDKTANRLSINPKGKVNYSSQVESINHEVSELNHELIGLKSYLEKSTQNICRFERQIQKQQSQNEIDEFLESITDLEQKIKLLDSNLSFFKSKCI